MRRRAALLLPVLVLGLACDSGSGLFEVTISPDPIPGFDSASSGTMFASWNVHMQNDGDLVIGVTEIATDAIDPATGEQVASVTMPADVLLREMLQDRLVQPGQRRTVPASAFLPRRSRLELRVHVSFRTAAGGESVVTVNVPVQRVGG